ncbi:hypothetical protein ON010_g8032 [Phytophthora cinnamomi]|nr:hypothetical protein ON010_g8032 [Phytophthora cinnamomi]
MLQLQEPPELTPPSTEQHVLETFLLEMDVSDFHAETLKCENPSLESASSTKPRPKRPRESWKRRKEDLQKLRAEVQTLQTYKVFLESQLGVKKKEDDIASENQQRWQHAAEQEKQWCQRSNDYNARLKKKLERCVRACAGIRAVLEATSANQRILLSFRMLQAESRLECCHKKTLTSQVFQVLESRVDRRYEELGLICHDAGTRIVTSDVDQVVVRRGGMKQKATALEFNRTHLLPFPIDVACDTVWNVVKLGVISNERCARVHIRSEDILVSQGCFTQPLEDGGSVKMRSQCFMKRVVVPEGCIFFVEAITEWMARPFRSEQWSHVTRDYGWAAVLPVATMPGVCQLQSVMRLQSSECMKNDPRDQLASSLLFSPELSDVMIPTFRSILNSRFQLVDNALLDASRAGAR